MGYQPMVDTETRSLIRFLLQPEQSPVPHKKILHITAAVTAAKTCSEIFIKFRFEKNFYRKRIKVLFSLLQNENNYPRNYYCHAYQLFFGCPFA